MPTKSPKFSILTPSYNHEKYVKFFIESVLNQTEQDFELIIVDDNSIDNNVKEIQKFSDERIILIQHEYNQGINAGLNSAFEKARGEYIVFVASDDMLEQNHLETCLKYFEKNPKAEVFYCSLSLIDENNLPITERENHYILKKKEKKEILKQMFLKGNCLFSPGMTLKKSAFEKIYPLDLSILQFQDYAMHVQLLLNGEIVQCSEKLIRYRQTSFEGNISAKSSMVMHREKIEEEVLMDYFLKMDLETLKETFSEEIKDIGNPTKETIPYFLGRLALTSKKPTKKSWGYRIIMNFIKTKENFMLLNTLYNFNFKEFINFANYFEGISNNLIESFDKKINKYKKLFNKFLVIAIILGVIVLGLLFGYFI